MKKILAAMMILSMLLCTMTGCGGTGNSSQANKYMATYSVEVKTLNPLTMQDSTSYRVIGNTTDGLVENDKYGRFVPSLAQSWENSSDYTVWTFKLREGVKWVDCNGKETNYEVTANDFIESLKYVADPMNGSKNVGIIKKLIIGLNDYYNNLMDIEDGINIGKTRDEVLDSFEDTVGIKALDNYTLQYTLTAPTPYFISYLVTEFFLPVNGEFLASAGENFGTSKEYLLFNGAYYISDWQRDKQIVLKKNETYWDKENVQVSEISLQKVEDTSVTTQMFQRGEISTVSLEGDQVKALKDSKWGDYIVLSDLSSVNYWFAMNFTSSNPEFNAFINNDNFRKALYYGIDRAKLAELYNPYDPESILRNTVTPEDVITSNGVDYTDYTGVKEIKENNHYDPELAKSYMDKAIAELCDSDGNIKGVSPTKVDMLPVASFDVDGKLPVQLVFTVSNSSDDIKLSALLTEMLKVNLGENNIKVESGRYVDNLFSEVVESRKFDMFYDSFSFRFADPIAQLGRLITDGGVNDGQYSDAKFDEMVEKADSIYDLNDRYKAFAEAEAYYLDKAYIIPWMSGGGNYQMTKVVPFTTPKGGFGITRFKYKGMQIQSEPVTAQQYDELKAKFNEELEAINQNS